MTRWSGFLGVHYTEAKKLLCDFLGISSAGDTDKTLSETLKKFIPKLKALFNNISENELLTTWLDDLETLKTEIFKKIS